MRGAIPSLPCIISLAHWIQYRRLSVSAPFKILDCTMQRIIRMLLWPPLSQVNKEKMGIIATGVDIKLPISPQKVNECHL